MKWVARLTYLLVGVAVCMSIIFVRALKPTSSGAFLVFASWLVLPYALMVAALIKARLDDDHLTHWYVVAALVSFGGILFLADVIFWNPDAQGGIAVLMTPILQGGASVLLLPVSAWVSRRFRA